ncbi:MAG: hypothetical protein IKU87_01770 [Clostridia bacterium]|nr:hypothetical protein [Clostridia bacterium]
MNNNNLAYDAYRRYRENETNREFRQITNIRTIGGVMINQDGKKERQVNNEKSQSRRSHKAQKSTVISVVVLVAMAFLVLFRGLMITSGYEKLEAKNAVLAETIAENQKIQFKIDQSLDLKNIEKIAETNFNMSQPTKTQTIYINLDQANEVKKVRGGNSVVDAVKNFFTGIVEYFA